MNQGVQFHKGEFRGEAKTDYGVMTAEDVVWSMQQWGLSKHPRAGQLEKFWAPRPGSEIIDDYTLQVHTGDPLVHVIAQRWLMTPGGASTFIASKKQTDELGVEAASEQMAATGPWEITDHRTGEFWKMAAVRDHWRHTPEFAEFIMWEIPEESSRVAGFQTGNLDTFLMGYDSIPSVLDVEGAQLMKVPNAIVQSLRIYGNWYPVPGVEARAGYDPNLPWISASDDVNSADWDNARKVRLALMTAIDRQALVDEILSGNGNTDTPIHSYSGFEHYLEGRDWQYDPDRAIQLLEEAGYPDGFSITLTPAPARRAPGSGKLRSHLPDVGEHRPGRGLPADSLRNPPAHAGGTNLPGRDLPRRRPPAHPGQRFRQLPDGKSVQPRAGARLFRRSDAARDVGGGSCGAGSHGARASGNSCSITP